MTAGLLDTSLVLPVDWSVYRVGCSEYKSVMLKLEKSNVLVRWSNLKPGEEVFTVLNPNRSLLIGPEIPGEKDGRRIYFFRLEMDAENYARLFGLGVVKIVKGLE